MANIEMADFLSTVTPDSTAATFSLASQRTLIEEGIKNTVVHYGDDGSEERISLGTTGISIFYVTQSWDVLDESDAGTIIDQYHNALKGDGMSKSFKWVNLAEPSTSRHVYVARFDSNVPRQIEVGQIYGVTNIKLKILGNSSDT